ncbi:MAG: hypothetical protein Q8P49_04405, partial [Candidatus Liptonbacteria bacterium]|nr:hypothetical protein [Candidatus Liptonbacteria bacterium]
MLGDIIPSLEVLEKPVTEKRAKRVMGSNFHTIAEAERHFKAKFTKDELGELQIIPATEAMLEEYRQTHILIPSLPLSILEMRKVTPRRSFGHYKYAWYNLEPF